MREMTQSEREQRAREFLAGIPGIHHSGSMGSSYDEYLSELVTLLANTERATLERVVDTAKARAYAIGLNEPLHTNHLYAFACDIEREAKEVQP